MAESVAGSWADAAPDPLVATLRAAGCVFAEDEARVLREAEAEGGDLGAMVARRVAGEPLEQVVGWADFCGLRIRLAPGVFVPRQGTGLLVDLAAQHAARSRRPVVVDLCCGSGAIGAAVAARLGVCELHAADCDPAAVACARVNLEGVGEVHEGDLFDALPGDLRGRVDVLAVNAPYVPTDAIALMPAEARDHEHRVALDGGPDGLDVHRRVALGCPGWLAPDGLVLVESGAAQADATARHLQAAGLATSVEGSGRVRVVLGQEAGDFGGARGSGRMSG